MPDNPLKKEILRLISAIDDEQQLKMISAILERLSSDTNVADDLLPDEMASILLAEQELDSGISHSESWNTHLNRLKSGISSSNNKAG
jgi:hypothetical protein